MIHQLVYSWSFKKQSEFHFCWKI